MPPLTVSQSIRGGAEEGGRVFVWSCPRARGLLRVLTFGLHVFHQTAPSPFRLHGTYWQPVCVLVWRHCLRLAIQFYFSRFNTTCWILAILLPSMGLSTCNKHTGQRFYYYLYPLELTEYFNLLSVNHSILVHTHSVEGLLLNLSGICKVRA